MNYDELERLVLDKNGGWALQRALAPLDEKARSKLSVPVQKLYRQLQTGKAAPVASRRLKLYLALNGRKWGSTQSRHAILAMFAVCPISVLKKCDYFRFGDLMPVFDRIIRDRRPEWLAHDLDFVWRYLNFDVLRGWIRDGVCAKPEVDEYYRMLASSLMCLRRVQNGEAVPSITSQLLADPSLLADVRGLFRVENDAFGAWPRNIAGPGYETWTDALLKLSADGHLDRAELLQSALDGLKLNLPPSQLSGLQFFYKRMDPSQAEIIRHQSGYIDLLSHPHNQVVTFALEMLGRVEKTGVQDVEPILRELPLVLSGGSKGNALAALRLVKRMVARQNESPLGGLAAISEALRHARPEVQSSALDILEANRAQIGANDLACLRSVEPFVAASNHARVMRLLSATVQDSGKETDTWPSAADTPASAAAPLDYHPMASDLAEPILRAEDAITPIETVEALIGAVLHAVELVESPDEVERIIDAISRLATSRPADFAASVAPLLHRMNTADGSKGIILTRTGVSGALLDLLYTWLTGRLHRTRAKPFKYYSLDDGFVPVTAHLRAIAARIHRGETWPLLSAPTHKGGWIDPLVWVERLMQSRDPAAIGSMDFRLSMLRLAPDRRAEALENVAALAMPLRNIANFALGGDARPTRADRAHHAAWITAARCRNPLKDWSDELAPLDLDDGLPDGLRPARYAWRASQRPHPRDKTRPKLPYVAVSVIYEGRNTRVATREAGNLLRRVAAAFRIPATIDWTTLPSAALNRHMDMGSHEAGELNSPWMAQWLCYVWPQNPAALCMRGAIRLACRIHDGSSSSRPSHGYFHPLFQRGRRWREPDHLLLCVGLVGKDADARGLAVDALIEGIESRLFDTELFASTIARLAESEWLKFKALADALMPVIPVSRLHAAAVGEALQLWLPKLDLAGKNAFRLLEVLVEAQALSGNPLREDARTVLADVAGSGKAAKIAKQLIR